MNNRPCFCLNQSQSPTHYNLQRYLKEQGWRSRRFKWQANFSDANLQFNVEAAETLEYKHLLARLVEQYCPEVMPKTYCINDENWPDVLNQIGNQYYLFHKQVLNQIDDLVWILKPSLLNNGKEIKIFNKLSELEQHYLNSKRLGGEHVLQQYITNPHLLRDRRKYSIRMFVIVTNYAGTYLYPHGYFNVAMHPFPAKEFSDLRPHLTNEHLQEDESNVIQIPSQRFASFTPTLYPQIKEIVAAIVKGLRRLYPQAFISGKLRTLAIYGFDFLVDDHGRLWLLEANHGPCFPVSDHHPLQSYLYYDFWQDFIASFVEPIACKQTLTQIKYHLFEFID
ncbi:hypothetical protein [Legionella micdadei]|uniref:Putative Tubulin--tyrosine ligase [TTL domain] n=1 Tax=Legionella micdadei TaxID=451 RepID=A0A098GAP6_LEGMI|nr:hypothetical protein [Legionella micdadei]ARG96362.1 hypothetical protein B6N58_00935 [Legionella micdadei]ARG99112.1 hypothetical protein B6V88_00930 [Legionella micdadei]KTD29554.1 Tubulin-tyrosine ligase family protein [Legionella micdadei]NSL18049.1 tubulin-tyrosine ligase [Legionella micdadei]CEG59564.1 putative Tubulin--tyrosine ligase [TTL domain] [Legionella micdadei]